MNEPLEPLIFSIRGRRVILDSELARIYGVSTKALNQAVKRFVTSRQNRDVNQTDTDMWSQFVTTSQK